MAGATKKVIVFSMDPWLDRFHGASVINLFESLSKLSYPVNVVLLSSTNKSIIKGSLSINGIGAKRTIPVVTLISLYTQILRLSMCKDNVSAIIADYKSLPVLSIFRLFKKTKAIMLILSRPVNKTGFTGAIDFIFFKLSLAFSKYLVTVITAISPLEAADFAKIARLQKKHIVVLPSPVGSEFSNYKPVSNISELRRKLFKNKINSELILLYHGSLDVSRNVIGLINNFIAAFKNDPGIVLLLVGDGSSKKIIESFIQERNIKNIFIYGAVPYNLMPELISACDIGLVILPDHPWWRNQCPTKLVEFLTLGKPVIASDLPGIRWVAGNSSNIVFVKSLSPPAFNQAVKQVLTMPNLNVAECSRVKATFDANQIALKLSKIINE